MNYYLPNKYQIDGVGVDLGGLQIGSVTFRVKADNQPPEGVPNFKEPSVEPRVA